MRHDCRQPGRVTRLKRRPTEPLERPACLTRCKQPETQTLPSTRFRSPRRNARSSCTRRNTPWVCEVGALGTWAHGAADACLKVVSREVGNRKGVHTDDANDGRRRDTVYCLSFSNERQRQGGKPNNHCEFGPSAHVASSRATANILPASRGIRGTTIGYCAVCQSSGLHR